MCECIQTHVYKHNHAYANTHTHMHTYTHTHAHAHIQTWLNFDMILNQERRTKHESNQMDVSRPELKTDKEFLARRA